MDSKSLKRLRSKYYVASRSHPELGTPCWLWTGTKWSKGYGCFNISSETLPDGRRVFKRMAAHKALWEHINGPVPEGLELDHLCRNPRCVNPAHLEAVTHAENVRRGEAGLHNPVKTHCPQGHAYDEVGFYVIKSPDGDYRRCKQCHADRERERRGTLGMVEVWCEYCKEHHRIQKTTHANNVKRNGRYLCRRHASHLAAVEKQVNPYADQGKKKCCACGEVKLLEEFTVRRASWDGLEPNCKDCKNKKQRARRQ